jgi:hypothetical protein
MNASMARRIQSAEALLIYDATGARRLNSKPTRSDSLWLTRKGTGRVENRDRTQEPSPAWHERNTMGTNMAAATGPALIPAAVQSAGGKEYTEDEVRRLVAALEEPFDPQKIKWRVTNTTKDRTRGQVMAYADQRAYTDRLNAIFTVRGWTRKYRVEMINNLERKTSHESESQMVGKVVVTCEVSIYGLGTHSGIGEEWTDNENAGTAAEAQAFKRACACFGLGRYLYDLEGGWVDLDNKKQSKSTPKLPNWALPKRRATNGTVQESANPNGHAPQSRTAAQDAGTLSARVKALSDQVGFSLSRNALMAVAKVDTPDKVDANSVAAVVRKLEDTLRGVERLRAAIAIVGQARFLQLCKELNFASDHLDDIPDREALRKAVETLEAEAVGKTANVSPPSTANGATGSSNAQVSNPPPVKELGKHDSR